MSEVDVHTPLTNPRLVDAMNAYRGEDSRDHLNHMIDEVMAAHFLIPVIMKLKDTPDEEGRVTLSENTVMQFPMLSSPQDEQFFMAFTDWQELGKWSVEKQQTVILTFDDYAAMIKDNETCAGFVINPFTQNMIFNRSLCEQLKQRKDACISQENVQQGETLRFLNAEVPKELQEQLRRLMKKQRKVHAAWLRRMKRKEEESWLVIMDIQGDSNDVFAYIAEGTAPHLHGELLDLLPLKDSLSFEAVEHTEPFYKRMFYTMPAYRKEMYAVVEDAFELTQGGCVVALYVMKGTLYAKDEVDVLTADSKYMFSAVSVAMEYGRQRISEAQEGMHCAVMIQEHTKHEFKKGCLFYKKGGMIES